MKMASVLATPRLQCRQLDHVGEVQNFHGQGAARHCQCVKRQGTQLR
jgi:hypothetical protein